MIDCNTGYLILDPSICIRPGDSLEAVVALSLGDSNDIHDMQSGWQWLFARNVYVEQKYFVLHFGFYKNRLQRISLVVSNERFIPLSNWNSWSERIEMHRLAELTQWLFKELGSKRLFSWGTITANYDVKSTSSSITIDYE